MQVGPIAPTSSLHVNGASSPEVEMATLFALPNARPRTSTHRAVPARYCTCFLVALTLRLLGDRGNCSAKASTALVHSCLYLYCR